jgi:hypothetical protein
MEAQLKARGYIRSRSSSASGQLASQAHQKSLEKNRLALCKHSKSPFVIKKVIKLFPEAVDVEGESRVTPLCLAFDCDDLSLL